MRDIRYNKIFRDFRFRFSLRDLKEFTVIYRNIFHFDKYTIFRRLSSIEKMDVRIYRPRAGSPEDTGIKTSPDFAPESPWYPQSMAFATRSLRVLCKIYNANAGTTCCTLRRPVGRISLVQSTQKYRYSTESEYDHNLHTLESMGLLAVKIVLITDHTCHRRQRK